MVQREEDPTSWNCLQSPCKANKPDKYLIVKNTGMNFVKNGGITSEFPGLLLGGFRQ